VTAAGAAVEPAPLLRHDHVQPPSPHDPQPARSPAPRRAPPASLPVERHPWRSLLLPASQWPRWSESAAALLLVLQVLHQERDLIAARQPSLRPVLAALCGLTGCEVSALRQIGDITIDAASFAREKTGDAYRLNFTLRNAAPVPLAMPAVELSLLDTQERAVVRRVLLPPEFGAPSVLPASAGALPPVPGS